MLLLIRLCDLEYRCNSIAGRGVNCQLCYLSLLFLCSYVMFVVRSDRSRLIIALNSVIKLLREKVKCEGFAIVGEDMGLVSEVM